MQAHGVAMTFALVFEELGRLTNDAAILDAAVSYAEQVMTVFRQPERKRVYEFATPDGKHLDQPPGKTVVPGHVLESMWFMIHIYQRLGNAARIREAVETMRWHIEFGWDARYGGIVLARDAQGSRWEKIAGTKIWWPHTEAIYALLLAYAVSREQWCLDWLARVHEYSYSHFPVPGYGEWIQNLDRQGRKLDEVVGLPVKDPFHLARSLINCINVLQQLTINN
jgi:N-acylglucosamine 2-epimerase